MTKSTLPYKYVFKAGWRKVTARGRNRFDAVTRARGILDRRAEKGGYEPPVAWDLTLIETDDPAYHFNPEEGKR